MKKILLIALLGIITLPAVAQNSFHFNSTDRNKRQDIGVSSGILTIGAFVNNCEDKYPENIDWAKILVGVGTATPTTTLHVNGPKSSAFRLTDGTEASGYVLTCDANGVGTWQPASGSGGGDHDWYTIGTTLAPQSILDNKYTLGTITIGNTANPRNNKLFVDSGMVYIHGGINSANLSSTSFFTGGPGTGLLLESESDYLGMLLERKGFDSHDAVIYFGDNPGDENLKFCRATWNTPTPAVHNFSELMRLTANGDLGIGTNAPTQRLTVFNGTTTGTYTTAGWVHSSDRRLKEHIEPVTNAMQIVNQLNGVYFDWKNNKNTGRQIGFIAQDVRKVLPEVVTGKEGSIEKGETLGMAYQNIVPVLVEALKEKDKEIAAIKEQLLRLEAMISSRTNAPAETANGQAVLEQNIPNPFSQATIIAYSINVPGNVFMELFDSHGRKIKTLESAYKEKGNYHFPLDGKDLAPGTYTYTLKLNGKQLAKKAIKL